MIEKLHPEGALREEIAPKINEIIDVLNALIDGEFEENPTTGDICRKFRDNIRSAQAKVKR